MLLHRRNDPGTALQEIERLLAADPRNPSYRNLYAVILSRVGEYARSSEIYAQLLEEYPSNAKVWLSYGHVLKTEGRQDDCIEAYRRSLAHDPGFGEAYWSLANLKTFRFSETDLATMHAQLARADLGDETGCSCILRWARRTRMRKTTRARSSITRRPTRCIVPAIPTTRT